MIEFFYSIDKAIFVFINQTLSNPIGDVLWPLITDFDKLWAVRIPLAFAWLLLLLKGGRAGRTVAIMIVPVIFLSDKLSSTFIKEWVSRPRPCHEIDGIPIMQQLHLLVNCGSGKSFPSSHAVNNFAYCTILSYYFRRWSWLFFTWASIVAVSRVAVGVHYPSDILGGAVIGSSLALLVIWTWQKLERQFLVEKSTGHSEELKS